MHDLVVGHSRGEYSDDELVTLLLDMIEDERFDEIVSILPPRQRDLLVEIAQLDLGGTPSSLDAEHVARIRAWYIRAHGELE